MPTHTHWLPVPEWDEDLRRWVPRDFAEPGDQEVPWPKGVDPMTLPTPRYHLGQEVSFRKRRFGDTFEVCRGEIRRITLGLRMADTMWAEHVGEVVAAQERLPALAEWRERQDYSGMAPQYVLRVIGHGHPVWHIPESDILG